MSAEAERDQLMRDLDFAECRTEPRDFVTAHRAKEWATRKWSPEVAERLFPGRQYGEPVKNPAVKP